ncbi:hypothetical protein [Thauera sp.]|uniref:hypothetical protein n=1 Tax=Thauera sp. TaxID=1905334 RepID=UPI0039E26364
MSGFGHYARTADELEREIYKRGLALGLDWDDQARMRELARQALSTKSGGVMKLLRSPVRQDKLTGELFALADLMLDTMRQSAQIGVHTSGGKAWKAFGRALYQESERLGDGAAEPLGTQPP